MKKWDFISITRIKEEELRWLKDDELMELRSAINKELNRLMSHMHGCEDDTYHANYHCDYMWVWDSWDLVRDEIKRRKEQAK